MTKLYFKRTLFFVVGLLCAIIMPAQDLPVLPADPAVRTGTLPNGTVYYIVQNKTIKGVADFSLVQKTGTTNIGDSSASDHVTGIARDALSALPRCLSSSAQEFFTSHGATPGKDGFVKVTDNSTQFIFKDVIISSPAVLDSTLLVISDIIDRVSTAEDPFVRKWYAPSDQAVVISGDVDPASVADRLKLLSLMTPSVESSPRKTYEWHPSETAEYVRVPVQDNDLAVFTASWRASRTPWAAMNTVQPIIYELFLSELGILMEEGIKREMQKMNIPVADVECLVVTGVDSPGDDEFSVRVKVRYADFQEAVKVVSKVVSDIDMGLTSESDVARVKRMCVGYAQEFAAKTNVSNAEYIDRCTKSFLYNGSLAALKTKVAFLAERKLADATELNLFNSIASAVLDPEKNLTVSFSPDYEKYTVRNLFRSGWNESKSGVASASAYTVADIPLCVSKVEKLKISSEKKDHISGGTEWVFSNGIKVIYKKMDTKGQIHYCFALNGGADSVQDLQKGEAAYISDYFFLSRINGIPAGDFLDVLSTEGVSMKVDVDLTSMSIRGSVPEENIGLMFRGLSAVTGKRETDTTAVGYYAAGEKLRSGLRKGTDAEKVVKINSIMCPDYKYISHKSLSELSPELHAKAESYFDTQLSKLDDGILVIVGNMDAFDMKKVLLEYVGSFNVAQKTFRRQMVRYQPSTGWSTYTVDGDSNSVDIALSVPVALTSDNYMAAEIAAMIMKKNLASAIIDTGMYLTVSHEIRIYPTERLSIHIALNEISSEGFSSSVRQAGPIEALSKVRSALSDFSDQTVTKADVDAFKGQLKDKLRLEMQNPSYWLDAVVRRHLAGKDFTTGYEARIDAQTVDKVKEILSRLNDGTRVEYITRKK